MEKVIQVPFEIPAPSIESIHDALFSKLNTILGDILEDSFNKAVWAELFHFGIKEYIRSIRDVIRYTNVFSLKYELLKNETDIVDLLGLTCLQVFEPTIYTKLPNYKSMLCGMVNSYSYERQKLDEDEIQKAVNALIIKNNSTENIESAKKIISFISQNT